MTEAEREAVVMKLGKGCWRKYGQKTLKAKDSGGEHIVRCYFKCTRAGCQVKKQVEVDTSIQENVNITITGVHNHSVFTDSNIPTTNTGKRLVESNKNLKIENGNANQPPIDHRFVSMLMKSHPQFVVADPHIQDCPIVFASRGFCTLTGYELHEALGRNCRFLQGPGTNRDCVKQIGGAIMNHREIHMIILNYKKDGSPFHNLLHLSPICGENGALFTYAGILINVSEFVNAGGSGSSDCRQGEVSMEPGSEGIKISSSTS